LRGEAIFGEHEKAGKGAETFGRRGGTVRRPRHNELTEFGVESRVEKEDYLQGLKNIQKAW
jgi:hypothetical protein